MGVKTRQLASEQSEENKLNIGLLGFKMAVNEGLTVFNLVDGIVDEFHDEGGTDEAELVNDTYDADSDFYQNLAVAACQPFSAGFSTSAITEPDTSTVQTVGEPDSAPAPNSTNASFTVPAEMTALTVQLFGAGGSSGSADSNPSIGYGGGGGYTEGVLAVTGGQIIDVYVGQGGATGPNRSESYLGGGRSGNPAGGNGGGFTGITTSEQDLRPAGTPLAPHIALVAGAGGGGGGGYGSGGGSGGGTTGCAGESQNEQTSNSNAITGGGGDQEQGGTGGPQGGASPGAFILGGDGNNSGGGAGWYGGGAGGGGGETHGGAGGGGSSYFAHPQITSGSTEEAEGPVAGGNANESGSAKPNYSASYSTGGASGSHNAGLDGYILMTGSGDGVSPGGTTVLVSSIFAADNPVTKGRIVVFEEDVETPTLNTDVIASISRDAGANYTAATLSDSGYVTGSSGQRILTGQADISGQPAGQSMRWKINLANNTVKIHGVSLQWS